MQRYNPVTTTLSVLLVVLAVATGCSTSGSAPLVNSAPDTPLPSLVSARNVAVGQPAAQTTPVVEATPQKTLVTVWWPDELYPDTNTAAAAIFNDQLDLFRVTYPSYEIELRRKRTSGLGGILATLRTAAPVAPGALPDLTLIRRSDVITAAREGLIVPIGDWIPADLTGTNLIAGTLALGEVDGTLYGIPYALTIQHTVYRPTVFSDPPLSFDAVIAAGTPYLFNAGESPVSWTVLLQYFGAGGRLFDDSGGATLNLDALMAVLEYYARGVRGGVFTVRLLDYSTLNDYWNAFVNGEAHIASVSSRTFLGMKSSVQNIAYAPIPSLDGSSLTVLDGWLWVVTTQNPDRQQRALAFLAWMMRVGQHGAFTEALGMVPSQTRALRLWDDRAYAEFAETLITTAFVFPEERRNNAAAAALQEAVADVLRGTSPEIAADEALTKLGQ